MKRVWGELHGRREVRAVIYQWIGRRVSTSSNERLSRVAAGHAAENLRVQMQESNARNPKLTRFSLIPRESELWYIPAIPFNPFGLILCVLIKTRVAMLRYREEHILNNFNV